MSKSTALTKYMTTLFKGLDHSVVIAELKKEGVTVTPNGLALLIAGECHIDTPEAIAIAKVTGTLPRPLLEAQMLAELEKAGGSTSLKKPEPRTNRLMKRGEDGQPAQSPMYRQTAIDHTEAFARKAT